MTPSESRARLADLRSQALAAGLTSAVAGVDIRLGLAAVRAIQDLERALAEAPAPDAIKRAHTDIVAELDASTASPASPIAPKKPVLGAAKPAQATGVLPRPRQPPAVVRGPTGPDQWDLEIPV
ncbi:hypothetical protein [Bosea robiniae]|uniref:Uncharacterized protein n=1 Tax=Bosea robiniae TaxID=1036780 RepID=A0ABY0P4X8_9HYPH|nr:hypothetical protein [Bosea robiniae]SDH20179.1 hypothetical protein SAMN05421844_107145 [Bosea robiniae]